MSVEITIARLRLLLMYKLVDNQYINDSLAFLVRCVDGSDGVPMRGLYRPLATAIKRTVIKREMRKCNTSQCITWKTPISMVTVRIGVTVRFKASLVLPFLHFGTFAFIRSPTKRRLHHATCQSFRTPAGLHQSEY